MTARPFDVVEVVTMQLVLSDATVLGVTAELGFRAADPYTVRAVFTGPHSMSTWLIGRELLAQGLLASQSAQELVSRNTNQEPIQRAARRIEAMIVVYQNHEDFLRHIFGDRP